MEYKSTKFLDRISQYPNRRRLKDVDTGEEKIYDIIREEGNVTQEGTLWNASIMNSFDQNIAGIFTKGDFEPRFVYVDGNGNMRSHLWSTKLDSAYAHYATVGPLVYLNINIQGHYLQCNSSTPPMASAGENAFLLIGKRTHDKPNEIDHTPLPDEIIPKFPTIQSCRVPYFYPDYYDPNYKWIGLSSYKLYSDDWGAVTARESLIATINTNKDNKYYGYIELFHNNGNGRVDFAKLVNQRPDDYKYRLDIRFSMIYRYI